MCTVPFFFVNQVVQAGQIHLRMPFCSALCTGKYKVRILTSHNGEGKVSMDTLYTKGTREGKGREGKSNDALRRATHSAFSCWCAEGSGPSTPSPYICTAPLCLDVAKDPADLMVSYCVSVLRLIGF
jgi:hypothetical protein